MNFVKDAWSAIGLLWRQPIGSLAQLLVLFVGLGAAQAADLFDGVVGISPAGTVADALWHAIDYVIAGEANE